MESRAVRASESGASFRRERPVMANVAASAIRMYALQAIGVKYVATGSTWRKSSHSAPASATKPSQPCAGKLLRRRRTRKYPSARLATIAPVIPIPSFTIYLIVTQVGGFLTQSQRLMAGQLIHGVNQVLGRATNETRKRSDPASRRAVSSQITVI